MSNAMIKNTLALFAITAVAGVLLGTVYEGTKGARAEQAAKTQQKAYQAVFAEGTSFEDVDVADALSTVTYSEKEVTVDGMVKAMNKSGEVLGYVVSVTAKEGYGGDISFSVGVDLEQNVTGISYLSIAETAGLGMKAKEDDFVQKFVNGSKEKDGTFIVNKDGNDGIVIDAIGGATITTRAVTKGVNAACEAASHYLNGGTTNE